MKFVAFLPISVLGKIKNYFAIGRCSETKPISGTHAQIEAFMKISGLDLNRKKSIVM